MGFQFYLMHSHVYVSSCIHREIYVPSLTDTAIIITTFNNHGLSNTN